MDSSSYVKWKEVFVSNDRGRKEVRYYLKREDGSSDLAVVGKEKKSLRPLSYRYNIRNKDLLLSANSSSMLKLKSRKEVVNWLNSIIPGPSSHPLLPPRSVCGFSEVNNDCQLNSETINEGQLWKLGKHTTEFLWLGSASICKKKRKHYQSFQRNGVKISVHDFVYVLAEEDKPLVAYMDGMYEDSRGNKMVVVRWFHKIDEVGIALPQIYNDREIFFSLCLQDLNIECIDGLASVLSPQHYQIFLREARHTQFEPFVCHMQFDNDDVKPFDITQVKGYSEQKIFEYMFTSSESINVKNYYPTKDDPKVDVDCGSALGIKPKKRLRISYKPSECSQAANNLQAQYASLPVPKLTDSSLDYTGGHQMCTLKESVSAVSLATKEAVMQKSQPLTVGAQVEVLCQDSGIRGCWLRALIIKKHKDKVKVRYLDIKDATDEVKNLEEWILSSRVALPDECCFRFTGRTTVRPAPVFNKGCDGLVVKDGSVVDVWWHDGWWEGIVIRKESEDNIHVYFPAEKRDSIFCQKDLRLSQEWLGTGWKQIKERPEFVTSVLSNNDRKVDTIKSYDEGSPPCRSAVCDDNVPFCFNLEDTLLKSYNMDDKFLVRDIAKDDLLVKLKWNSSRKRKRSRNCSQKLCQTKNRRSIRAFGARTCEKFFIPSSVKVDHENCKYSREPAYSSSIVSPLSNLVLSR